MSTSVSNTINEDATGYIKKEKLEARLHFLFGYPIQVRRHALVAAAAAQIPDDDRLGPDYYEGIRPHLRHPTFVSNPEKSNIYVFDSTPRPEPHTFTNSELFESHIAESPKPDTRIVSICCRNSMEPLGITEQAMRKLTTLYDIDASFFNLVVSFGDKPRSSDAGNGAMNVKHRENNVYDMHYLFAFAEDYTVKGNVSWTIRQICVFHRYDPSGSGNLWILLHSKPQSKVQQQIERALSTNPTKFLHDWYSIHLLVFSAYLGNWRWCIRNLGDEIERTVDIALTLDLSQVKSGDNKDGLVRLLKQQYLGDKMVPLASRLEVALLTLRRLERMNTLFHHARKHPSDVAGFQVVSDDLAYHITCLEGHLKSCAVLEKKVQGISDLLAVALTLQNQTVTIGINNKMLKLTNESFDENATIKVVTLVTLIYLPASFVSTVLGMNLFDFNGPNDSGFTISNKFWIFVVIAVPLTLLTVGSWYFITRRRLRARYHALHAEV
ncbi:hypothetical protein FE257_002517 [Aspergillus nanangensis]|uniref:CorA-like transporter domain-containing protein n=1 Tax=Aspergillus nanangensis TaxID=2582783 RepID=A0AAD4CSW3_ASPNN|nr:hypothetical protein FE257_002517 [Aspergillus nanangensis]